MKISDSNPHEQVWKTEYKGFVTRTLWLDATIQMHVVMFLLYSDDIRAWVRSEEDILDESCKAASLWMNMSWQYIQYHTLLLLLRQAAWDGLHGSVSVTVAWTLPSTAFGKTDDCQTARVHRLLNAWPSKAMHRHLAGHNGGRTGQPLLATRWYSCMFLRLCFWCLSQAPCQYALPPQIGLCLPLSVRWM